jgi:hypothetical protein
MTFDYHPFFGDDQDEIFKKLFMSMDYINDVLSNNDDNFELLILMMTVDLKDNINDDVYF